MTSQPPSGFGRRWDTFWFSTCPPHTYAVLRITYGVLGLVNLLGTTPVSMFWQAGGLIPLSGGGANVRALAVEAGLGPVVGWVFFGLAFLAFFCMALGIRTQAAVIAAFLACVFQISWNPLPLSAAHQALSVVIFALVWADCGQVLSLDARLAKPATVPTAQSVWPLRLLQYQVCLIYATSGFWKLFSPSWRDGTAIHWALTNNVFHRFPGELPAWTAVPVAIGTYATLAWEMGFALLVLWKPTRLLALALGVMFHGGVWATMEVGPFSWMLMGTYVAFLPPDTVARLVDRIRGVPSAQAWTTGASQSQA